MRSGVQQFLEADDALSIVVQRKLDYSFGSNFRLRLSNKERELFDAKLEFGTDAITENGCPTTFKRDIILSVFKYTFIAGIVGVAVKFFYQKRISYF